MKEKTGANYVIFAPNGMQKTAFSEEIDYRTDWNVTDEELIAMIGYAKELGLNVALKPTANCADGTWRAHINFFDEDVVCEPKWGNWFASYRAFQEHYAGLAQQCGVDLFIAGCEMVQTERREAEWREVIAAIRRKYDGLVSYNTDKYQEHNVKWWDAVDVISSSGYYPIDDWDNQLDRIEQVVKKFDKPFFFAEAGCMSVKGSNQVPNDWGVRGDYDEKGQADWFQAMFDACEKRDWVGGFGSLKDEGDMAQTNFTSEQDAAWYAEKYKQDGLKGGHIILLNSRDSEYFEATKAQALLALSVYPGGMQVGGGSSWGTCRKCQRPYQPCTKS